MSIKAAVITVSNRAVQDAAEDRGGPVAVEEVQAAGHEVTHRAVIVQHREVITEQITTAIVEACRLVLTVGSTGLGPHDVTPEATRALLTYELPGIADAIRRRGQDKQPQSLLSRGVAGVVVAAGQSALVVNAPSSRGGVRDTLAVVLPLLGAVIDQLDGVDRHADRTAGGPIAKGEPSWRSTPS